DLGRGRQPLLDDVVGDLEQPQLEVLRIRRRVRALRGALEGLEGGIARVLRRQRHARAEIPDGGEMVFDDGYNARVGSGHASSSRLIIPFGSRADKLLTRERGVG